MYSGIGEAKKHDSGFIEAIMHPESGFVFATFLDADMIISSTDV